MTEEIKNRIEQVKSGQISVGYKKTEVGIVPEEWKSTVLSKIFLFKNGLNKEKEAFGKGTPIVNYIDVYKKRGLRAGDLKGKVELSDKEIKNYNVQKGDVFFTRTSETVDEIGMTSVILDEVKDTVFSGFILRARPFNKHICTEYNQYCYSSDLMRNEIRKKSSCTTRALTNGVFLGQVNINLPSFEEQQRIADILMKWDEAISLQEKLIEKLEEQKKALMRRLLTPKEGGRKVKLQDICEINKGVQINNEDLMDNATFKMMNGGISESGYLDKYNRQANTIIISEGGNSCGYVNYIEEKFWCGGHCYSLDNVMIDELYLFCYLKNAQNEIMRLRVGSGLPNIQKHSLLKFVIHYPVDDNHMKRISRYLFSVEKNIEFHKQKLTLFKQQQKALMQLLLTGIVRV